ALAGFLQFGHADRALVAPRGQDGGLIDHVFQVGAHKAGRLLRKVVQVYMRGHGLAAHTHLEDLHAPSHLRATHGDATVKAARAQQSRVKNVGPVGGRDQNDVGVCAKAVHLNQDLVERLLALVVGAAQARAAVTTDCIDLVDKDDAGAVALGLLKEDANASRYDPNKRNNTFRT